jgi:hypothetical protein
MLLLKPPEVMLKAMPMSTEPTSNPQPLNGWLTKRNLRSRKLPNSLILILKEKELDKLPPLKLLPLNKLVFKLNLKLRPEPGMHKKPEWRH